MPLCSVEGNCAQTNRRGRRYLGGPAARRDHPAPNQLGHLHRQVPRAARRRGDQHRLARLYARDLLCTVCAAFDRGCVAGFVCWVGVFE